MATPDSRKKKLASRIALGGGFGTFSLAFCFWVGFGLLHSSYYVEWLAAAAAVFCLLLAWLLHLREDGFMGKSGKPMKGARIALISAAVFLLLATLVLYFVFGFGTSP
ncbi:MAG: hypothetical protein NT061_09575 [Spirochaetes bacterium]|nr:hypothetical protein [Spirochaetota bacterium]